MKEYGFTITNAGRDLLTKILAGSQLTITKVMVGNGKLSGQDPVALTDLVSPKHPATATVPKVTDGTVTFTIQYQNQETGMVTINEYGVFAQDPDAGEILLYYATLGDYPQYVMPGQGDIRRFPVSIALSANDVEVNLAFDSSAFISAKDLDTKVSKSGDTMTGDLILPNTTPTKTYQAVHKKYVDDNAGGKRTCRFVVGTSTAGWTEKDCDYLCDGTDDQVEIQAAINALPSAGGEVVVLDGTYNITDSILLNKNNIALSGCGAGTVLKNSNSISKNYIIKIPENRCIVRDFYINGNESVYGIFAYGRLKHDILIFNNIIDSCHTAICVGNFTQDILNNTTEIIISNNICKNNDIGIFLCYGCSVSGNICYQNRRGIYIDGGYNSVNGNILYNNTGDGIYLNGKNGNVIEGNQCCNNSNGIYLPNNSDQEMNKNVVIVGNLCNGNSQCGIFVYANTGGENVIVGNICCKNNDTGIYFNKNSTVQGNICNNNTNYGINSTQGNSSVIGNIAKENGKTGLFWSSGSGGEVSGNDFSNNVEYGIYTNCYPCAITGNNCSNNSIGIFSYNYGSVVGNCCNNNTSIGIEVKGIYSSVVGNSVYKSSYSSTEYSIKVSSNNNLIANNLIWGKNYVNSGTGNTFVNNKYN